MMCLMPESSPTDNLTFKPLILARRDALLRFQCPLLIVEQSSAQGSDISAFGT